MAGLPNCMMAQVARPGTDQPRKGSTRDLVQRRPSKQFPAVPVSEAVETAFGHKLFRQPGDVASDPYVGQRDGEGRRHGHGTHSWAHGDEYEGDWVEDRREGHGVMRWSKGAKYEGEWLRNKMHGEGEFVSTGGNRYVGSWADGKRQGQGVVKYGKVGEAYKGQFEGGKKHGSGEHKSSAGAFAGEWREGRKHGWGKFERKVFYGEEPSEYEGSYNRGRRTGYDRAKREAAAAGEREAASRAAAKAQEKARDAIKQARLAELQAAWSEHVDEDSGLPYWHNAATEESTFETPFAPQALAAYAAAELAARAAEEAAAGEGGEEEEEEEQQQQQEEGKREEEGAGAN